MLTVYSRKPTMPHANRCKHIGATMPAQLGSHDPAAVGNKPSPCPLSHQRQQWQRCCGQCLDALVDVVQQLQHLIVRAQGRQQVQGQQEQQRRVYDPCGYLWSSRRHGRSWRVVVGWLQQQ